MIETEVILALINKLPSWFVIAGCGLYAVRKLCDSQLKHISKLLGKYLIKNNNCLEKINNRLDNIEKDVKHNKDDIKKLTSQLKEETVEIEKLIENDKDQNDYINMILNEKGERKWVLN